MGEYAEAMARQPSYPPTTVEGFVALRRFGSGVIHKARVESEWFVVAQWIGPPYWALMEPAVAVCGAVLRPDYRGLVAMQPGQAVTCRPCKRSSS